MSEQIFKALESIRNGGFVVVTDDESRENEGDLIMAAEKATPETLAFMIRYTSGIICAPLKKERLEELQLPQMVTYNGDPLRTAFTVSVDYRFGTTTGISSTDRAATLRALVDGHTCAEDFHRPGHIFPLMARPFGVLERPGHTEAAVDLSVMAGLSAGGVLAELVNDDGSVMNGAQLQLFADKHNIPFLSIEELIAYRKKTESILKQTSSARLPTSHGTFTMHLYKSLIDTQEHIALVMGDISSHKAPLVRVHSECKTGDLFGSLRCDCGAQLEESMRRIAAEGAGVLIYLSGHEGRGIGLAEKLRAYTLQDEGMDTVQANIHLGYPADLREYSAACQILKDLSITSFRLLTNNMHKFAGLDDPALHIVERVPLVLPHNEENQRYLETKREKMGHILPEMAMQTKAI